MSFAAYQFFFGGIAKKINNMFLVNSNKISIGPYLNEKLCWANQIFVDSTKHFSGCNQPTTFFVFIGPLIHYAKIFINVLLRRNFINEKVKNLPVVAISVHNLRNAGVAYPGSRSVMSSYSLLKLNVSKFST